MQNNQDRSERQRALDPQASFIVQAPAGSGKTALLIQRYLVLLSTVNKPEEVLAITFTKKAASEMRMRLIKALKEAQVTLTSQNDHDHLTRTLAKRVLARDRDFNWQLIENPNQLRIQTIDSFCSYLTKQLPLLSHFGAQPAIAEQPLHLYSEAVQEVLSHIETHYEWSGAVAVLLWHLDNDLTKLHDLLVSLLAKRDQWLPYLQLNMTPQTIRKQLESHLSAVIADSLKALHKIFQVEPSTFLSLLRFAATNVKQNPFPHPHLALCQDLTVMPSHHANQLSYWLGIAHFLLTKEGEWRRRLDVNMGFPPLKNIKNSTEKALHQHYREAYTALIDRLKENETLKLTLHQLTYLPEPHYTDAQWQTLQALLTILKIVAAQLRITFTQHAQIDFIENTQAALLALGDEEHPTDLALALDYQIKHILIDEFQDTSITQYQLIEKLTRGFTPHDGRSLFVVGDPMQSIYRFREAEVGLFIRTRRIGLGHIKLIPLTLSANFRSTKSIVNWNNHYFSQIFPQNSDMATGAVNYNASVAYCADDEPSSSIRYLAVNDPDLQAAEIMTYVQETLSAYPHESIAILVRSRSHLAEIIPALKKARIPYKAVDIDPLATRPCIQDLLSLTSAYLHPFDRIAWLAVLRAPWCGLTLSDLLKLTTPAYPAALLEQLGNTTLIDTLTPFGQIRIKSVYPLLKRCVAERGRYALRATIETLWLALGGPACLNDESELQDTQAYFELLESLEQATLTPEKLKEKVNRAYANADMTHTKEQAQLQIMTIHTAKGLEFDTVIVPHLEKKLPHDDKPLLAWMEQPLSYNQTALLLAPIHAMHLTEEPVYDYILRKQRIKLHHESDRLFYVATTRAKKRLALSFYLKNTHEDAEPLLAAGSFLEKIWPLIKHNVTPLLTQQETPISHSSITRHINRLSINWQPAYHFATTTPIAFHRQQAGFQLPQQTARRIGTVCHRLLQTLAQQGTTWWTRQPHTKQQLYLRAHLTQAGVLIDTEEAIAYVAKLINNTLQDKRGQWILAQHPEAQSEWALSAILDKTASNETVNQLIIDRTFVTTAGTRWIIDYKTTALSHGDVAQFIKENHEKYKEKMQTYANALHLLDHRPIKLGLYFPAIPTWHEWEAGHLVP